MVYGTIQSSFEDVGIKCGTNSWIMQFYSVIENVFHMVMCMLREV